MPTSDDLAQDRSQTEKRTEDANRRGRDSDSHVRYVDLIWRDSTLWRPGCYCSGAYLAAVLLAR
jgi:hypothetical protein